MTPKATAAKKASSRPGRTAAAKRSPGPVVNDSDVEMYYPTLGVTLQPGQSYTPKAKE